jgi:hypothetical protein
MRIFIIIRDGGTVAAKSRGIEDNTYYVKVRELRPTMVEDYFRYKKQSLLIAIEGYISDMTARHPNCIDEDLDGPDMDLLIEHCPLPCNEEENWYGRRCEGYCPVAEICQKIRKEQEDNHETTLPEM